MQSLAYQQSTGTHSGVMINRAQPEPDNKHDLIRAAVRAWSAAIDNQDVVSALIIAEYREQGGTEIDFPEDISRARQKLFRFLDNRFDSDQYRENVRELTPAIMAVLPLEYRGRLVPHNDTMSLIADAIKECGEAKQAVLLNAPEHQKLKEVSEGIASLFRLMPEQVGPLMTMVTSMLGVM
ncbi:putative toxin ydaT [Yokenella regensburgei]|uniref:Toxin ydaT n=1 Tax=Yokenella regensburgei TaxID=158877 RepID=A0ABX9S028_9ENTR|nr:toxin YdaT domain-containing protein [Yokenella regensburgei]RKR63999.1 putative toxin ydaT [Yokenella regensburgei]VFS25610.1 Protein of uncharacterised function (DUF1019) [Yokenella regensburgei]